MSDKLKIRTDVFISSTSEDLKEYRKAVMDAVMLRGFHPIGMENWAVSGDNPVDLCKREVEKAEVFIGIYAYRYGWQPDGFDGKSITELEYDWAIVRGIPCFCFIIDDKHPWAETAREPEKLTELKAFKARLKTTYIGFFTTPDNLKAQVIASLAKVPDPISAPDLAEYCRVLHQQSKKSNLLMALTENDDVRKRSISIDEVYTPLHVIRQVKRTPDGQPILISPTRDELSKAKEDKKLTPLTAMEATNAYSRLVLLGDPGSGKTIFVNYLALCMTGSLIDAGDGWLTRLQSQGWTHDNYLPISIILRDFASGLTDNSFKAVLDHIAQVCHEADFDPSVPEGIKQYLQAGQALVLFDGLDEVPSDKREVVRDALHSFMERYPHNRYIVTCRILSYTQPQWQLREMDAVETFAPLNKTQIAHFVNAWYTLRANSHSINRADADKRIAELTQQIKDDDLLEMASNPLLLTVMTFVHNSKGTLPKEKARLYDQCVEWLLLRWKGEEVKTLFKLLDLRGEKDLSKILWEIAYDAHLQNADKKGAADISEARILAIVRKYVNNDLGLAQKFCDYVQFRAGLLIGRGTGADDWRVFTFPHRTFQEFLAGQHLLTDDFQEHAPKIARLGTGWREVMLLATGYLVYEQANDVEVAKAVESILYDDPTTTNDWQAVWLAGEMLTITRPDRLMASERGKRVIKHAKDLLVQLIEGAHLPPVERAKAGQVLSALGDPRRGVGIHPETGLPDIVWCHVPAGEFTMGSDDHYSNEKPAHKVDVPDFHMSRYLITYAQYQAFENAPDFGEETWWDGFPEDEKRVRYDQYFQYANHPREMVTWYGAMAFCRWLTHHINEAKIPMTVWDMKAKKYIEMPYPTMKITLPSEAEYEKMARGEKGLIYPYGNDFDPNKGNTAHIEINKTSTVGLFPDGESPYGVLDASGNVFTWTRSIYTKYKYNSNDGREDEAGNNENIHSLRGGSWLDLQDYARASYRNNLNPNYRLISFGFFVVCRPY